MTRWPAHWVFRLPPTSGLTAVLAAGLASRFGGGKLDAPCNGQPLGQRALATAQGLGWPVVVVVGPKRPRFLAAMSPGGFDVVVNPAPEAGLGGSVAQAARAAQRQGAEWLLVVLADMPLVTRGTLERLVEQAICHGIAATIWPDSAAAPRPGVPAAFARRHFAALAAISGETGARDLLLACPAEALVAPDRAELLDVDRPGDLAAVAAYLAEEVRG